MAKNKNLDMLLDFSRYDIVDKAGKIYTEEELKGFPLLKPLLDVCQDFYIKNGLDTVLALTAIREGGVSKDSPHLDYQIKISKKHLMKTTFFELFSPDQEAPVEMVSFGSSMSQPQETTQYVVSNKPKNKKLLQELNAVADLESLKTVLEGNMLNDDNEHIFKKIQDFYKKEAPLLTAQADIQPLWFASMLFEAAMRGAQVVAQHCAVNDKYKSTGVKISPNDLSFDELVLIDAARGLFALSLWRSHKDTKEIKDFNDMDKILDLSNSAGYRSASSNLDNLSRLLAYAYLQQKPELKLQGVIGVLSGPVMTQLKTTHYWGKIDFKNALKFVEVVAMKTHQDQNEKNSIHELLPEFRALADKQSLETLIEKPSTENAVSNSKILKI